VLCSALSIPLLRWAVWDHFVSAWSQPRHHAERSGPGKSCLRHLPSSLPSFFSWDFSLVLSRFFTLTAELMVDRGSQSQARHRFVNPSICLMSVVRVDAAKTEAVKRVKLPVVKDSSSALFAGHPSTVPRKHREKCPMAGNTCIWHAQNAEVDERNLRLAAESLPVRLRSIALHRDTHSLQHEAQSMLLW
jgi:hypothetical protein